MQENWLWIFGYGSLMWRPDFEYCEARVARLYGYHRALCIYSHHYRGTPDKPGLVFGLDKGGSCKGIAFRIRKTDRDKIFSELYKREMPTKVYIPTWLSIYTGLEIVRAYGFVADRQHRQYAKRLSEDEITFFIKQGRGSSGTCLEYVTNTLQHLIDLGIKENRLRRLLLKAENDQGIV